MKTNKTLLVFLLLIAGCSSQPMATSTAPEPMFTYEELASLITVTVECKENNTYGS